ncbi:HIT family hydrolase [Halalkaliarchaeum desulfuricum]|uniref:HIT family hydrolase n=1 Tax=Halalkaliarchaeum desulfuricum TaxID=2055893 RepID=A0A343TJ91_9EURY|nr:HIT domain-containing protein [Halalkaliarchaeum desulfuricum]AUX09163.1 HIT family hydrolase [Halalkaliarchaeum desulfuricum]
MDQLFAPWRIEWIEREEEPIEGCPFCVLPDRDADRESRIVARSEHAFVLLNNYPYNPGHVMVIPYAHEGEYGELSEAIMLDHAQLKAATFEAMRRSFDPAGFNAGMNLGGDAAGGSIDDHVHTHVVPRWRGDTNYMAVIGDTTVIVEGLAETYDRLHEAFAELDGATATDLDDAVEVSF